MATTALNEIYQLPSPPLSPSNICIPKECPSVELAKPEIISPPSDIPSTDICSDKVFFEQFLNSEEFIYSEEDIKKLESVIGGSIESPVEISKDEILRNKFMNMIEEGVDINGDLTPYPYAIEILHSLGSKVINKKTKDAISLRVYETDKDNYEDFLIHPVFLTLQSYQFFKLFEEIKEENGNNREQALIEIEIPSLKAFSFVLYFMYTGDHAKLQELSKSDPIFYKNIMEVIECLEVNMAVF